MSTATLTPGRRSHKARAVPETMRAAAIDRFGGPDVITVHTLPVPEIDKNEVLIAVHTAGVASWDADVRAGWYPAGKPRFPLVLGTDGSGTVAAVGSRVRRFTVGDPVYAYSFENVFGKGGFYAQYVAVVADRVAHVPDPLDMSSAGAVPATGLTALQGIDDVLHVRSGERVLIHGASGGVGTLAVQFAKLRNALVLASASGRDGLTLVRRLGADDAVDGHRQDILEAARHFAPGGIDAVLALAGGKEQITQCLDALHRGGRFAYPNGVEPEPRKRRGIDITSYDVATGIQQLERLRKAIEASELQVPIAATYALAWAPKAHERLAARHVLGKIVLRMG